MSFKIFSSDKLVNQKLNNTNLQSGLFQPSLTGASVTAPVAAVAGTGCYQVINNVVVGNFPLSCVFSNTGTNTAQFTLPVPPATGFANANSLIGSMSQVNFVPTGVASLIVAPAVSTQLGSFGAFLSNPNAIATGIYDVSYNYAL